MHCDVPDGVQRALERACTPRSGRCAALASVTAGTATRCQAAAEDDGGDHCAHHARALAVRVREYKARQAELCEGAGLRWAAIASWIEEQTDAGRLLRTARGLVRVAQRRFGVSVAYFYGRPADYVGVDELAGSLARMGVTAGVAWPDPEVAADEGHAFAVLRALCLARTARDPARGLATTEPPGPEGGSQQPAGTGTRWWLLPVEGTDDADDDGDDDVDTTPANAGPHPRRTAAPRALPPPRDWTAWERLLHDAYWTWLDRVAPLLPAYNVTLKPRWELAAVIDKLETAMAADGGGTAYAGAVIEAIDGLGMRHARLFAADLVHRQVVIAAGNAVVTCRAGLGELGQHPLDQFMIVSACALRQLCLLVTADQVKAKARQARAGTAGALATRRCAAAVLKFARDVPMVYRGALATVLIASGQFGAMIIAAACVGMSPESDESGLAFNARFHRAPDATYGDLRRAGGVAASVALRLSALPEHEAVRRRTYRFGGPETPLPDTHPGRGRPLFPVLDPLVGGGDRCGQAHP